MESNEEKNREEIETILKEHGLSESDLEKLRERKFEEISDEAKEVLKKLELSKEDLERTFVIAEDDAEREESAKVGGPVEEEKEQAKETEKEEPLGPRVEIEKFLRERLLSQSFINTFLKIGFTDEFCKLLCAMGFTIEETEELRRLWNLELEDRFEIDSFASLPSSSNEYLSSDGLFLKNLISKPLTQALREIVAKKPFDPIEYLGHWLLNYKICEEREQRRKEFELELMLEREKLPLWDMEEETFEFEGVEEEEEEEGLFDYQSFLRDE